jgi:type VI secretion system secreted protein VgrG
MAEERIITVEGPSDLGEMFVYRAVLHEELGRPFNYKLELLSLDPAIKLEPAVGKDLTLTLDMSDDEPRHFHGIITRLGQGGMLGRWTRYTCRVRPFLWLLKYASDSRIFQGKTVPEIVAEVLKGHGYTDMGKDLEGTYQPREYCVQYRESDFDFISRLMEEEGIYYYFRHEEKKHTMVLADGASAHKPFRGSSKELPYRPDGGREQAVHDWEHEREFRSAAVALNDYDFETPRANLLTKLSKPLPHAQAKFERYDPLASFVLAHDVKDGKTGDPDAAKRAQMFAKVRLEEYQAEFDRAWGETDARDLSIGHTFTLAEHPNASENRKHMVIMGEYRIVSPGYDAGGDIKGGDKDKPKEPSFVFAFETQPDTLPFRPESLTPEPVMSGPHTALVVGTGEIWTDKHGRVKILFPWDRLSADDGSGSCWARVSQAWSGGQWGSIHVPRVGQEVIVEFIEGDPDRPIVTGRVYNGTNMPPYELPGKATQSGILSRSSEKGSADNANELRFEDKKGEEQVFTHAEKNMDTEVENDQTLWVGHDRHKKVDNDQTEDIKGNKTIHVVKDHKETIDETMSLTVAKDEDETIGGDRTIEVGGDHNETIKGNQGVGVSKNATWAVSGDGAVSYGGEGNFTVAKALAQSVGKDWTISVGENTSLSTEKNITVTSKKNSSLAVGEGLTISVKKDWASSVEGNNKTTVTKNYGLEAKEIVIEATGKKITLKAGDASISLSDGNIEIKGSKITVKGSGDLVMKGSKITGN